MVLPFQHKREVTSLDKDPSSFPEGKADWNMTTIPQYFRVCIHSCRPTASYELGAHKSHSLPPGRKPRHAAEAMAGYDTDQWPSDAWRKWTVVRGCTVAYLKEPIENISTIEWQNITDAHTLKPCALELFDFEAAMLTSPSPSPAHHPHEGIREFLWITLPSYRAAQTLANDKEMPTKRLWHHMAVTSVHAQQAALRLYHWDWRSSRQDLNPTRDPSLCAWNIIERAISSGKTQS